MRREETAPERELIEVDQQTTLQIYTEGDLTGLLEGVKQKILEATPENLDLSIKKNRDIHISNAANVSRAKVSFDNAGKAITEDWKAKSKKVDGVRKYFRDCMDYFRDETRQPVTIWEAEEARKEEEARLLAEYLADLDRAIVYSEFINREREVARKEAEFAKIEEDRKAKEVEEIHAKAQIERETRLKKEAADNAKLEAEKKASAEKEKLLKQKAKAQADKEEAKRKLKEAEQHEKEMKDNAGVARHEILKEIGVNLDIPTCREMEESVWVEFHDKKNSEYQADQHEIWVKEMREKRDLETKKAADQAKIDQENAVKLAEQKAADNAKRVERDRLETERIERVKAEKKAANVKHQKKINGAALDGLMKIEGISADLGKDIIVNIAHGLVPNISINY